MLETQRKVESVGKTIAKETPKVQTEEPAVGGRTSSTLKRNRYVLYHTVLYYTLLYCTVLYFLLPLIYSTSVILLIPCLHVI